NLSNASGATIADPQGQGTIQNDDGTPSLAIQDVTKNEGNSGLTVFKFVVTVSNPSSSPITVHYQTFDGTATVANNDYQPASGTLTIQPKTSSTTIEVDVVEDITFEQWENFKVVLSNPVNATLGTNGTGTIQNDDAIPNMTISDVTVTEGNSGPTAVTLKVS